MLFFIVKKSSLRAYKRKNATYAKNLRTEDKKYISLTKIKYMGF